jgi:CBS domain-containing protein
MAEKVRTVMTADALTVRSDEPLTVAAKMMRDANVGAVVVLHGSTVYGVLTDRDIAVRVVAEEIDPRATRVDEVVTHDLVAVSPTDDVETAVELMRTHAVRRLPVVDGERLVGMIALGDVAIVRDSGSALAEISAEEPNN